MLGGFRRAFSSQTPWKVYYYTLYLAITVSDCMYLGTTVLILLVSYRVLRLYIKN